MNASNSQIEDHKSWTYAFVILVIVSLSVLILRIMNQSFLSLDFEISLFYLPTVLAGIVAFQVSRRDRVTSHGSS